jgi:hypothetical protein
MQLSNELEFEDELGLMEFEDEFEFELPPTRSCGSGTCGCGQCRETELAAHEDELEYEGGVAQRHFQCAPANFGRLLARLRTWFPHRHIAATAEDLRRGLATAVNLAIRRARGAAAALRAHPRSAAVERNFQDAFGVRSTFVPSWRTSGAGWKDLGELVAIRLAKAAKDLADGSITFSCWDDRNTVCTGNPENGYRASTPIPGRRCVTGMAGPSKMCLGKRFWFWLFQRKFESMAAVLVHEALHDYFLCFIRHGGRGGPDTTAPGGGARRFRNANCYVLFMMRFAGKRLTPCLSERCHDVVTGNCARVG